MSYQFRLPKGLLIINKENVRQLAQTNTKLEKATGKLGQTNKEYEIKISELTKAIDELKQTIK
ncbi:MAG: hypothetical protein LBV23_11080 [Deltaproteobacteria bacterium]|jgi:hypothetical protein|nr:hypothetical protein [Deltaproteobacteria bacterium]